MHHERGKPHDHKTQQDEYHTPRKNSRKEQRKNCSPPQPTDNIIMMLDPIQTQQHNQSPCTDRDLIAESQEQLDTIAYTPHINCCTRKVPNHNQGRYGCSRAHTGSPPQIGTAFSHSTKHEPKHNEGGPTHVPKTKEREHRDNPTPKQPAENALKPLHTGDSGTTHQAQKKPELKAHRRQVAGRNTSTLATPHTTEHIPWLQEEDGPYASHTQHHTRTPSTSTKATHGEQHLPHPPSQHIGESRGGGRGPTRTPTTSQSILSTTYPPNSAPDPQHSQHHPPTNHTPRTNNATQQTSIPNPQRTEDHRNQL
jgi:hypothetical protein